MSRDAPHRERVDGRSPGRPRDAAIDELVLRATIDVIAERGVDAATIQAVSERCGVARATIYLRWSGRTALILAALRWATNRPPMILSGDIATDLATGAAQAQAILSQPMFIAALPALVQAFIGRDGSAGFTFDTLFPNRLSLVDEYARLAGQQDLRPEVDPTAVVDAILGALLMHLMRSGKPPSPDYARSVVALVVAGTRRDRAV
jgi:AcrR family transcriptional regulator